MINYIDVTDKWIKEAKPKSGKIAFANIVRSTEGIVYSQKNAILEYQNGEDLEIGTWFKNNIWGDVKMQPSVKFPENVKSSDLLLLKNCPFFDEQTLEIKTVKSNRKDGLIRRLKEAREQSSNVLIDITDYPYDLDFVKHEINRYILNHKWLKTVCIKKHNKLAFACKSK